MPMIEGSQTFSLSLLMLIKDVYSHQLSLSCALIYYKQMVHNFTPQLELELEFLLSIKRPVLTYTCVLDTCPLPKKGYSYIEAQSLYA